MNTPKKYVSINNFIFLEYDQMLFVEHQINDQYKIGIICMI